MSFIPKTQHTVYEEEKQPLRPNVFSDYLHRGLLNFYFLFAQMPRKRFTWLFAQGARRAAWDSSWSSTCSSSPYSTGTNSRLSFQLRAAPWDGSFRLNKKNSCCKTSLGLWSPDQQRTVPGTYIRAQNTGELWDGIFKLLRSPGGLGTE